MKVLMVNHFPLDGSGSGTYTKNIAVELAALGHEVRIVLPENTPDYPRLDGVGLHPVFFTPDNGAGTPKGALPFNFPCFTTHPRSTTTFGDLNESERAQYLNAFRRAIDDEVASFAPDVVHAQHLWMLAELAAAHAVPLVVTAHGTDLMGCEKWPHLRESAERAAGAAHRIITISADNRALVERMFPTYADKAVSMRNGYNAHIFYPARRSPAHVLSAYGIELGSERVVLFAGKLTHFKGVDVALRAAALYGNSATCTVTVIAGDGTERASLERLAAELHLSQVHFIGNVSQDELARLYDAADVDLVPSRREPFGLVAIEALACGTPVVASNEGGLPDFVNSEVGRLVAPEDPRALAAAVLDVLAQTERDLDWHKRIAAYARENYSQARIIQELVALYEQATATVQ